MSQQLKYKINLQNSYQTEPDTWANPLTHPKKKTSSQEWINPKQ
jgi:hypothetical protein